MPTKPKKRDRKPGVKVRPSKNHASAMNKLRDALAFTMESSLTNKNNSWNVTENTKGETIAKYSPAPVLTLCGQLEDSILLLENRISNAIAKINSLM